MASGKLLTLSDFEWASAVHYIVYISRVAGLREINSNHVISFPLGRLGHEKLLKRKERVLASLEENRASIERFAGEKREELGDDELAVIRTIYLQYKANIETVKGHIEAIEVCLSEVRADIFHLTGEDDNEPEF